MKNIAYKYSVLIPSVIFLAVVIVLGFTMHEQFTVALNNLNIMLLSNFSWAIIMLMLAALVALIAVAFSPLGNVKIGGEDAVPMLSGRSLFTVSLCTAIAGGMLFWGFAEPVIHMYAPPKFLNVAAGSAESAKFALSATYLHWNILPCALNSLTVVAFALMFYNCNLPYSLSSPFRAMTKRQLRTGICDAIDVYCIISFLLALVGSMALGIMSITGGLSSVLGIEASGIVKFAITLVLTGAFTLSAVSGVKRGIKLLSNINFAIYIVLLVFFLLAGPTKFIFNFGMETIGYHFQNFIEHVTLTNPFGTDSWALDWNVFYFAGTIALTPITALFLGKIFYGHTVKEVVFYEFVLPVIFTFIWFTILGGLAIDTAFGYSDIAEAGLKGSEYIAYAVMEKLPFSGGIRFLFIIAFAISFITAADSVTNAIAGLASSGYSIEEVEPPALIKIIFGVSIGIIAFWLSSSAGALGLVKAVANIGGFTGLVYEFFVILFIAKLLLKKETTL